MTMQKAKEVVSGLVEQFQTEVNKFTLETRVDSTLQTEEIRSQYAGGVVRLEAGSDRALIYGLEQLLTGYKSGHNGEFLGTHHSHLPFRPLWLGSDQVIKLSDSFSLGISKQVIEQTDQLCRNCLMMGYNAVILGGRLGIVDQEESVEFSGFLEIVRIFNSYNIQVYLKPQLILPKKCKSYCPLDRSYQSFLQKAFSSLSLPISGYFWESALLYHEFQLHDKAKEMTLADLVLAEVKLIEENLKKEQSLLFYIPTQDGDGASQHASWLPEFCDDVGNNTMIAFSSVSGDPAEDHLCSHPLWEALRRLPDVSATRLLPIVNSGAVDQGEGLWPAPPFDSLQYYLNRCFRHHFAGVIGLANQVPENKGLLHMCLWVAGHAQWSKRDPYLLAETWCTAYRKEWDIGNDVNALDKVRWLVKDLSRLRGVGDEKSRESLSQEECRCLGESIIAQLKQLSFLFHQEQKKGNEKPSFLDYFTCFSHDARHVLSHVLQKCNVPLSNIIEDSYDSCGFWTKRQGNGKITLLDQPVKGRVGSSMEKIYYENREY